MVYEVSEVAKQTGVSVSSIKMWESRGLIPKAKRTVTNRRIFDENDVAFIRGLIASRWNPQN